MWTAVVDPRVLTVRAIKPNGDDERLFDAQVVAPRWVRGPEGEHLAMDCGGASVRLDVFEGTVASGPVALRFDIADDWRLDDQLAAIRAFRGPLRTEHRHERMARNLLALHALDLRNQGISLREAADTLLGPGDWPGDGEHRKSLVRRLIAAGIRMVSAGPKEILKLG